MAEAEKSTRPIDALSQICGEIAAVFRRAWGRGPIKTTAHWASPDALLILLENGLTDAEKTLRLAGRSHEVHAAREMLLDIIEPELNAVAERAIGRPVRTSVGATRLDPDLSSIVFMFGPAPAEPAPPATGS